MLGRVLDEQIGELDILVERFVPESTRAGGRNRARPDIFAPWTALAERKLRAGDVVLPPVIISANQVLAGNVSLDEDGCIPFDIFDRLQADHGIDVSGLSLSRTARGNLYRAHLLMKGH